MMSYSKGESHLRHTDKVVRRIKSEDFRVGGGGGRGRHLWFVPKLILNVICAMNISGGKFN